MSEATQTKKETPEWRQRLQQLIPVYGHRNWIVVADSAYPAQSRPGIETIYTGDEQLEVLKAVLDGLGGSRHVKPIVLTDAELDFVEEKDAPGISDYRTKLAALLGAKERHALPHEQIIARLDAAGAMFNVLILKTTLTIPYTSVFFELDCKYWNAEAEGKLRKALAAKN